MNREEKLQRVTATATMNLELIIDTMTSVVMDMIEEAKILGIYKQERKNRLNHVMHEMKLLQNRLDRKAGDIIDKVADYNEAFSEQIADCRAKSYEEAKKVIAATGVANESYLAYLHQARVVGIAAYTAIKIWTRKMEAASSPLPNEYTLEPFRPKKVMDRMQQLLVFEFHKYRGRQEESESAKKADMEFVGKMADTGMICAIMEGRIRPSWVVEDEAKKEELNNSTEESVNV